MSRQVEVLVVDDNPGDLALIRESFGECSVQSRVTPALDAELAFEILSNPGRCPPDLVIIDVNLPRVDGFELLRRIRANPRLRVIPVVVMSSSTRPSDVERAYDLGANAYVPKPSDLDAYFAIARGIAVLWLDTLSTTSARRGAGSA